MERKDSSTGKRIFWPIVWLFLAITLLLPVSVSAMSTPSGLGSHYAFSVIDANSGKVLMKDKMNRSVYPASTTKLMTAMVILEQAKAENISLNTKVKVTDAMLRKVDSDLTSYGMEAGEVYTLKTLMHMVLISSYGDATVCASIAVFGSVNKCVKAMNAKAVRLGLKKTHFDNPAGLDIGDGYNDIYTTAYEMACITRAAMQIQTIRNIVAKASYTVKQANGTVGRVIYSTNLFYRTVSYPSTLYTIIGSKSGTTKAAGYVFTATATDSSGHEVICTYMGKTSTISTFTDIQKILTAVFQAYQSGQITLGEKSGTLSVIRQSNVITAKDLVKEASTDSQSFKLGASALGNASLTYTSSAPETVKIGKKGNVTVEAGFTGKVEITVKAKATEVFKKAARTITLTVKPTKTVLKNTCTLSDGTLSLYWKKRVCCGGYVIQYSADKSFKTDVTKQKVSGKQNNSLVIEDMAEGQTIYVRIRTYVKTDSGKLYSAWSKERKISYKDETE